jgi:hypothetical protein
MLINETMVRQIKTNVPTKVSNCLSSIGMIKPPIRIHQEAWHSTLS